MTKTSIYCYEKNGGGCRNKVSPANNFICSAGHSGTRQGGSVLSESPVVAPVINLAGMSTKKKLKLARDPFTSLEFLDELARSRSLHVRVAVAWNGSAWPETLALLAGDKEWSVRYAVAENSSASFETHISFAQQGQIPWGFTKGKPIDELIENVALVDQYPDTFGMAYLHRLLERSLQEDRTHPKRRALIGYAYAKLAESDETPHRYIQSYKDKIKVLFPDDQEMAEIIEY